MQLSLTTSTIPSSSANALVQDFEKTMLFKAVALLRGLKELHMAEWEAFVGSEYSCSMPLWAVPGLSIHVRKVKDTAAFTPHLKFLVM